MTTSQLSWQQVFLFSTRKSHEPNFRADRKRTSDRRLPQSLIGEIKICQTNEFLFLAKMLSDWVLYSVSPLFFKKKNLTHTTDDGDFVNDVRLI